MDSDTAKRLALNRMIRYKCPNALFYAKGPQPECHRHGKGWRVMIDHYHNDPGKKPATEYVFWFRVEDDPKKAEYGCDEKA